MDRERQELQRVNLISFLNLRVLCALCVEYFSRNVIGDETFELDAAKESELLAAIAEAERGELVSASEVLRQIRRS